MEQDKNLNVLIAPLIDSQNPPVGVDSVIVGESGTGAVRLTCFAGEAYVVREEEVSQNGEKLKKLWIRPICVIDMGNSAVEFLESYLLFRLSSNIKELKTAQEKFPEFMKKIYEELKESYGAVDETASK